MPDLNGGARRNRTDDLFNAIDALSQLSYGPTLFSPAFGTSGSFAAARAAGMGAV